MLEGLIDIKNISFLFVFLEGLLSFFSPCVLPLIPVYMSYLSGHGEEGENGYGFSKRKVFVHTLMFIIGISFSFFILGMSFSALGTFFQKYQTMFTRIGGILIILLGLFQLGFFELKFLHNTKKIPVNFYKKKMNPLVALVMGFTFSFAWTPCVGPALSSVLILASSSKDSTIGYLLVFLYTLGFVLPFLLLGFFTTGVLEFLQRRKNSIKYTVKIGGAILVLMGFMTFTGWMNGVSKYLNTFVNIGSEVTNVVEQSADKIEDKVSTEENPEDMDNSTQGDDSKKGTETNEEDTSTQGVTVPIIDFTLEDQYGNTHTLSEYKGKVVFLNFWATWCPPCQKEMPDIEALYKEYNQNQGDVIILGIANPSSAQHPHNADVSKEEVTAFLSENEYTFPVVMDTTGEIFSSYYINAYPTTFMIDKNSNIYGYVASMLTKDIMESIIEDTLAIKMVE